jgi:hypothetical protein
MTAGVTAMGLPGLILICLLSLSGCSNKHSPHPAPAFMAKVHYKSKAGEDLLNSSTSGHIDVSDVKVSSIVLRNGVNTEVPTKRNAVDPCPTYLCNSGSAGYYINFVPDFEYRGTLIRFGTSRTDTLSYKTIPMNSGVGISKVLYKGHEIWALPATYTSTDMDITIVE